MLTSTRNIEPSFRRVHDSTSGSGPCSNAAYAERLDVSAMATDGYSSLSGYNASDNAAFALAVPCPPCVCPPAPPA